MNCISYKGIVKIYQKDKLIQVTLNSGTDTLFNVLCSILSGVLTPSDVPYHIPCYMSVVDSFSELEGYNRNNSILLEELEIPFRESVEGTCTFKTMLSRNLLNLTSAVSISNDPTLLLLNSRMEVLAYTTIKEAIIKNVASESDINSQATIEWMLMFANGNIGKDE